MIDRLEQCIAELDPVTDDPEDFNGLMEEWIRLKRDGLKQGSSEWVAVIVEAEQRTEAFKRETLQHRAQRGDAFVRDREKAAKGGAGLGVW